MYVLKFDGMPICKPHSTHLACIIEAYELGHVLTSRYGTELASGFTITETDDTTKEPTDD